MVFVEINIQRRVGRGLSLFLPLTRSARQTMLGTLPKENRLRIFGGLLGVFSEETATSHRLHDALCSRKCYPVAQIRLNGYTLGF